MINPWLTQAHQFEPSPERELASICIKCGQWQFTTVHYRALEQQVESLTAALDQERATKDANLVDAISHMVNLQTELAEARAALQALVEEVQCNPEAVNSKAMQTAERLARPSPEPRA